MAKPERLIDKLMKEGEADDEELTATIQIKVTETQKSNFTKICKKYKKSQQELAFESLKNDGLFEDIEELTKGN